MATPAAWVVLEIFHIEHKAEHKTRQVLYALQLQGCVHTSHFDRYPRSIQSQDKSFCLCLTFASVLYLFV